MPVPQSTTFAPAFEFASLQESTSMSVTGNDLLNCAVQGQIANVGKCNAVTHNTALALPTPYAQLPVFIFPPAFHSAALRSRHNNAREEVADTHGLN
jgi:hypothetical protein